jgi:hypothetical protein
MQTFDVLLLSEAKMPASQASLGAQLEDVDKEDDDKGQTYQALVSYNHPSEVQLRLK